MPNQKQEILTWKKESINQHKHAPDAIIAITSQEMQT